MIKNKEDIENIIPYNTYKYIVETIKPYTKNHFTRRQSGICIQKKNYKYFKVNYYIYKAETIRLYDDLCIVIHDFPISNFSKQKKDNILNLYSSRDLIKPILVFVNNKHIEWENIDIIIGNYTYIHFKNFTEPLESLDIYELNFTIDYIKGRYKGGLPFISFNNDGTFNSSDNTHNNSISYVLKDRIDFEKIDIKSFLISDGYYSNILNNSEYKIIRNSIITFDINGLLDDKYDDRVIINNFNSLKVENFNGKCLLLYNYSSNKDKNSNFSDHFQNIEYWEDYLTENNIYNMLYDNLELHLKTKSNLPENYYIDSLCQILSFNYGLFKNIFNRYFNWITTYRFKVKDLLTNNSILSLHKRHYNDFTSNIIVFINGRLIHKLGVNYTKNLNNIIIDLQKYDKEDEVVILYYKKSENRIFEVELIKGKNIIIDPTFSVEDAEMYTTSLKEQEFGIFNNRKVLYKIPFSYTKNEEDKYSLYPKDEYYYDSTVSLSSVNQFRHYSFEAKQHLIKIILPSSFKTCNNFYKYSAFINGLRISQFNYKLVYPSKTTPFKEVMIYLQTPVNINDEVDIIYTPVENKEIFIKNIDNNIIEINKENLEFPLDPDLYTFYINGKLIDNKSITYISNNKIIIDPEIIDNKYNLSIVYSIKNDSLMSDIFKDKNDILTEIANNIPNEELYKLTNIDSLNTDLNEDDYQKDNLSAKSIIFEIIKDHWIENGIYKGIPTLYDYEKDEIIDLIDNYNNITVDILNASKGGKIGC